MLQVTKISNIPINIKSYDFNPGRFNNKTGKNPGLSYAKHIPNGLGSPLIYDPKNPINLIKRTFQLNNLSDIDFKQIIDQGQKTIQSIESVEKTKLNEKSVNEILIQMKQFMQSLLDKLNEFKSEISKQVALSDIENIVKAVAPSTVMITGIGESRVLGSGVIIHDNNGKNYILTNAHVTEGIDEEKGNPGTGFYKVVFYNGTDLKSPIEAIAAPVLRGNGKKTISNQEEHDIALLEIVSNVKLPKNVGVKMRDVIQDPIRTGEPVIAVGAPFGNKDSVTFGIVSHANRWTPLNINDYIQTDAAIDPGNSGGGLFDMKGRLIGINTWGMGKTGGAIRIDNIQTLLESWNIPVMSSPRARVNKSLSKELVMN